jgi:hypothetical protein
MPSCPRRNSGRILYLAIPRRAVAGLGSLPRSPWNGMFPGLDGVRVDGPGPCG